MTKETGPVGDIIERIRTANNYDDLFASAEDAVDEIERLREKLNQSLERERALKSSYDEERKVMSENIKLREEVKHLESHAVKFAAEVCELRYDLSVARNEADRLRSELSEKCSIISDLNDSWSRLCAARRNELKSDRGK